MWRRRTIAPIGLSIDTHDAWPVHDFAPFGAAGLYQPVADTDGAVFLRYGPGQTLDDYVRALGDRMSTPSVVAATDTRVADCPARRLDIDLRTADYVVYDANDATTASHRAVPARLDHIAVLGFVQRGTPVLVGYRIADEHRARYHDALEHIVRSVAPAADVDG